MKKHFGFGFLAGAATAVVAGISGVKSYERFVEQPRQEEYEAVANKAIRRTKAAHQSRF
ncbi:DUF3042 domain-containing protein [Leuconostocaceae bacterium ESL0958]|nr:DUF3042 domain-containing protein [Leuconostocaceae bacterium ESL0958]